MHRESEGPSALEDLIRYVRCPSRLHFDRRKMKLSNAVKKICRKSWIPQDTTEAKHPWQNPCERTVQEMKKVATYFLDLNNAPKEGWVFAFMHSSCLNRTYSQTI